MSRGQKEPQITAESSGTRLKYPWERWRESGGVSCKLRHVAVPERSRDNFQEYLELTWKLPETEAQSMHIHACITTHIMQNPAL
jgi:hypothetical protein